MLVAYVDAYLVVGLTIHNVMMNNLTVDQNRLVNELHVAVQDIYYKGVFKFMNSCLFETLNSAISRFSELGICISKAFASHIRIGKQFIYLKCPLESKEKLERIIDLLTDMSSVSLNERKIQLLETEVAKSVYRAQGPLARL